MRNNYFKTIILILLSGLINQVISSQILISNADELKKIGNDADYPLSENYHLTGDIDLGQIDEWIPIGATSTTDNNPTPFTGILDGNGFTIKNLNISTGGDLKGLFATMTSATVKNLTLEVNIKTTNRQVGAIAGSIQDKTHIERVAVKGSIEALENVGGIVGRVQSGSADPSYNIIRNCYVNASIKSTTIQAGGIAGRANGSLEIENVYVAGKIEAAQNSTNQNAAGIVAYITSNFIQLLSSVVVAEEISGGTPNYFYSKENKRYPEYFENLYARNDIHLQYAEQDKGAGAEIVKSSMLLDPEQFREQSFYTDILHWDFENVWRIGEDGYPQLRNTTNPEIISKPQKVKVACIGNSITANGEVDYYEKYPSQLQELLGRNKYAVRNYGTGGYSMLREADLSFWDLPRLESAKNWVPDILIIKLGTNDTKDVNWDKIVSFEKDYIDFIQMFKEINPSVKVYACYPIPAINRPEKDERIKKLIQIIDVIAEKTGATIIDLYTPFIGKENYYVDDLHPGVQGTTLIANIVYNAINADYWKENPLSISDYEDLKKIGNDVYYLLNGAYYLTNHIEIPEGTEWIPIGAANENDTEPAHFTGVFDGKDYSIKNLRISTQTNVKGLFGRLGHATVKNLDLINVDIKGNEVVGGIAGAMFGESRIERVSVSGNIEGYTYVGGIVGRIPHNISYPGYNIIEDCYVTANVTANSMSTNMDTSSCAGGIAGFSVGNTGGYYGKIDIRRVYVTGKIVSQQYYNPAGNSAGILAFYDMHNYIKMDEVLVLCDDIESATPNLFFSRRGPGYADFELFRNVFAHTGISLSYLNDADKGRGGEIPEQVINYFPIETYRTKEFYDKHLNWDFNNVWTIKEGSLPVLKRKSEDGNTKNPSPANSAKNSIILVSEGLLMIFPQTPCITLNIFNLSGNKIYNIQNITTAKSVKLPQGIYIVQSLSEQDNYTEKVIIR